MQSCVMDRPLDALTGRGEIFPEAQRCHSGMSCLLDGTCGSQPMCPVEFAISPDMAFVSKGSCECRYYFQFGGGHVCNCPVRVALHRMSKAA